MYSTGVYKENKMQYNFCCRGVTLLPKEQTHTHTHTHTYMYTYIHAH